MSYIVTIIFVIVSRITKPYYQFHLEAIVTLTPQLGEQSGKSRILFLGKFSCGLNWLPPVVCKGL